LFHLFRESVVGHVEAGATTDVMNDAVRVRQCGRDKMPYTVVLNCHALLLAVAAENERQRLPASSPSQIPSVSGMPTLGPLLADNLLVVEAEVAEYSTATRSRKQRQ
jgi:hypothetical protein